MKSVETNIVIFRLTPERIAAGLTAPELAARLKARGILASAFTRDAMRLVTHLDVSRGNCIDAAEALAEEIEAGVTARS